MKLELIEVESGSYSLSFKIDTQKPRPTDEEFKTIQRILGRALEKITDQL